ncbi:MAG: GNAT family protein [Mucilaginibacter sp.]|uniref:GNAT family N-acetyltransferase n=1 Tax=Mucilaginibacter sp. TaxID=1882438 RepID=UPI0032665667
MLNGSGFCLREWKLSDEASLIKHASNPNVSRFLADRFPYPYTTDDAKGWLDYQTQKTVIDNLVIDIDGELVGGIGIDCRQDIFRKTALIGYWLGEPFWGRGIMAEAVKLMVEYAFEKFDLVRIQAGVFDGNPASMRVLEKAAFIKECISKNALFKHNKIYDEHVFVMIKP